MIEVVLVHGGPQIALGVAHGREEHSLTDRHDSNELDHFDNLAGGSCWKGRGT